MDAAARLPRPPVSIPKENMGGGGEGEGRSLAETPTWSVATVTTAMVAICFLVERSIYRFGKWLKKTKRKALLASLDKMREELMLLGIISLMLTQTERKISEICVPSSLFTSRFYFCTDDDFDQVAGDSGTSNQTMATGEVRRLLSTHTHDCGEGHEPFVSLEALEQLHRFLFTLGITHVIYSCVTVVLAMVKIYSWRKWEGQAVSTDRFQERKIKTMRRQCTFVFQNASHPWSKSKILIWMLCFVRQFKGSVTKSDYMALRLGFIANHRLHVSYNFHKYMVRSMEDEFHGSVGISWPLWIYAILCIFVNIHGVNIYFWLSFVPVILVVLVGTKLRHVVAQLALDAVGSTGPLVGNQLKPRDDLFWFGKPVILLWLIQFISFQNAFEMATFIWSLSELNVPSCFMKNHVMISIRIISGIIVQFWCSYCTLPLNVIVSQMGSKFKKTLISESVRESLHSWCKRVRAKSRREHLRLTTTTSTCSLTDCEEDETVVSGGTGTLSPTLSLTSLDIEDASRTPTQDLTVFDISEQHMT